MKQIRLIQLGPANNALISNLMVTLNDIQNEFLFSFSEDVIQYPEKIDLNKPVSTDYLETIVYDYAKKRYPNDYPIAICDCILEEEVISSYDQKGAIITTKDHQQLWPGYSLPYIVAYVLIDVLLSMFVIIGVHQDTKGCPLDYCDDRKDMKVGLEKCEFCPECRNKILQALSRGQINLAQYVAIQKILDYVAQRKICFVLMPFKNPFVRIYERYIKPAIISNKWQCYKADEIYEPREIIDLIQEQIMKADIVVAELTGRNPNVFYELGYAHALNKNTILLTQSINDVPFDLRHRQLVHYSTTLAGYNTLTKSLQKYFKQR